MGTSRDHLVLYLNGERLEIAGVDGFSTLTTFLRRRRRMLATKVVCEEGDCGACTVLVGRLHDEGFRYLPVDACITFLFQLDATHIVTVEGLAEHDAERLHPVQQALIDFYGSQCGFCTPGFVAALTGVVEDHAERGQPLTEDSLHTGLSGNLCRCTGYVQVLEAARSLPAGAVPRVADLFDDHDRLVRELRARHTESVEIESGPRRAMIPASVELAVRWRSATDAVVVAGATDLGVLANKGRWHPEVVLVLGPKLAQLTRIAINEGELRIGGLACWAEILDAVRGPLPQFAELLERFGAPQIRNSGTIGGNLVNASPIADSAPALIALGATLELRSVTGARRVPLERFVRAYKEVDLGDDELLLRVDVPLPDPDTELLLYKISRRRDLDISTVTAAVSLRIDAGVVARPRVVVGGVAPVVLRLAAAERILDGAPLSTGTFAAAGRAAAGEITPISDVRGSAAFRRRLTENVLRRAYHDLIRRDHQVAATA